MSVFSVLMAVGKKLFLRRVVLALKDLYRLPEGRRVNRWWPGWEESFKMLLTISLHSRLFFLSTLRNRSRYCAFFTVSEVLADHERSSVKWAPRNLKVWTFSTQSLLMWRGPDLHFAFCSPELIISFLWCSVTDCCLSTTLSDSVLHLCTLIRRLWWVQSQRCHQQI